MSEIMSKKAVLKDLVAYQAGAIVSKTLIDKKTGTVTLFAFDKGQKLSEHITPYDALVLVLDGKGEIVISGEAHQLSEGEAIVMPANVPHAVNAKERFKMLLIMIRES